MRLSEGDLLLPAIEFDAAIKARNLSDNEKEWIYAWKHCKGNISTILNIGEIRKAHYEGWFSARMY